MSENPRTTLARGIVAGLTAALLVGGAGSASADDTEGRSYPGCPLLLEGQTSSCVERLKQDLNTVNPGYDLDRTPVFDAETRIAVLDFQGRRRLPADGNVGGQTADALAREVEPVEPPSEACPEGDRSQATEIANTGRFTTVREQTLQGGAYDGLTVSLRVSDTIPGCAWGLFSAEDDALSLETHAVWIDRSLDGGATWEKLPETSTGLFSGVTHTGVYDARSPASVRVCGVSYHQPLRAASNNPRYEVPDVSPFVCTDWWTQA